jgi:1,4-alpha-glucan branching enzyme
VLTDFDAHLIAEGTHLRLYERLGAHPGKFRGRDGTAFAVWAPNASSVCVVGDFNAWDAQSDHMQLRMDCGVWEAFVPQARAGQRYKFAIRGPGGEELPWKADPLAFSCELRPKTASIIVEPHAFPWSDDAWMRARPLRGEDDVPLAVYEVHLGSWKRAAPEGRFLTYAELADELIPYAVEMGFTHLELMPISEHPFDGSWGYQPIGLFAPTSRFGSPDDFRTFVDRAHAAGLGVIIDWVPGHFPGDGHGLREFDGTALYEHADPRQGFHPDWNTYIYNFGRTEVKNFLIANALFWCEQYHVDGLRVDAVASMLYLDYSRPGDEWIPNPYGGRENIDAIGFLRWLNEVVASHAPGVMMIAEESTAWPRVSGRTIDGGLGFSHKWNMGWMHDTLEYFKEDPVHRRYHHDKVTFGLLYAWDERFVLPLSHDEVVHGKGSILARAPGDRWQKFANVRMLYAHMYAHPGKKLLFMGDEFAQEYQWRHDFSLDWHQLDDPLHAGVARLVRDCNHLYRQTRALGSRDFAREGFSWVDYFDHEQSIFAYLRFGDDGSRVLTVVNARPVPRLGYRLGAPGGGYYRELLNSDAAVYGGSNMGNAGGLWAEPSPSHGFPWSLSLTLPPLATLVFDVPSEHDNQ